MDIYVNLIQYSLDYINTDSKNSRAKVFPPTPRLSHAMLPFRSKELDGAHNNVEETRDVSMNDVEDRDVLELTKYIDEQWDAIMEGVEDEDLPDKTNTSGGASQNRVEGHVEQQNFSDVTDLQQADKNVASNITDPVSTAVEQESEGSDLVDKRAHVPPTETNGSESSNENRNSPRRQSERRVIFNGSQEGSAGPTVPEAASLQASISNPKDGLLNSPYTASDHFLL